MLVSKTSSKSYRSIVAVLPRFLPLVQNPCHSERSEEPPHFVFALAVVVAFALAAVVAFALAAVVACSSPNLKNLSS
jgi:hypothetical protein